MFITSSIRLRSILEQTEHTRAEHTLSDTWRGSVPFVRFALALDRTRGYDLHDPSVVERAHFDFRQVGQSIDVGRTLLDQPGRNWMCGWDVIPSPTEKH